MVCFINLMASTASTTSSWTFPRHVPFLSTLKINVKIISIGKFKIGRINQPCGKLGFLLLQLDSLSTCVPRLHTGKRKKKTKLYDPIECFKILP